MNVISCVVFILFCTGCAVFSKNKQPDLIDSGVIISLDREVYLRVNANLKDEAGVHSLSITDEIKSFGDRNENCIPVENKGILYNNKNDSVFKNPALGRLLCETILAVKKYGNFSKIRLVGEMDNLIIEKDLIEINWEVDLKATKLNTAWHTLNYLTLTIIPYRGEREYKLVGKVLGTKGQSKEYHLNETMVDWSNILLLPFLPFVDGYRKGTEKIHANMVANLLNQINKDGVLK